MKLSRLLPFFLLVLAACQASSDKNMADSDIYFSIAREYIAAGETAKGLEQIEKAINANSANLPAYFLKAETLALAGRYDEALKAVEDGGKLLPPEKLYQKKHWLGVVYYHKNDLAKAAAYMEESAKDKPDFVENHILLGQVYAKSGKPERASTSLQRWTELEPESWQAWGQLGIHYVELKKYDEAKMALDKSLSINQDNAVIYNYLGSWAMDQNRWDESEEYLQKSIKLDNANPYSNLNYAQFLMLQNRHREAYPYLMKTYELDPGIAFGLYWLGKYHYKEKDYDKAEDYFTKAIDSRAAFWPARMGISKMSLEKGRNFDTAISVMENGIKEDPGNMKGYYYYLAKLTLANKNPASALNYSKKAEELLEKSSTAELSELYFLRGEIYEKLNQKNNARAEYKKVVQLTPGTTLAKKAGKQIRN